MCWTWQGGPIFIALLGRGPGNLSAEVSRHLTWPVCGSLDGKEGAASGELTSVRLPAPKDATAMLVCLVPSFCQALVWNPEARRDCRSVIMTAT
ncbi:hypothetical protein VTI74DRAFT_3768 [Chaetomium olivicolor]